jgi:hypothetical protein
MELTRRESLTAGELSGVVELVLASIGTRHVSTATSFILEGFRTTTIFSSIELREGSPE